MDESNELKTELLEAAEPPPSDHPQETRRNSKQALIDKILELSEKQNIPMAHSNTKLKRMNKSELADQLAEMIEIGMRRKMARQVGCSEDADSRTIALGALRMLHDVCAVGAEKAGNAFLEPKGYEIQGFSEALKEPTVSDCIDRCLQEIADENQEILEYVKSPYTRLAIAWGGAIAFSCKKKQRRHVTIMEPRSTRGANSVRRGRGRGTAPRQEHPPALPSAKDVKSV